MFIEHAAAMSDVGVSVGGVILVLVLYGLLYLGGTVALIWGFDALRKYLTRKVKGQ